MAFSTSLFSGPFPSSVEAKIMKYFTDLGAVGVGTETGSGYGSIFISVGFSKTSKSIHPFDDNQIIKIISADGLNYDYLPKTEEIKKFLDAAISTHYTQFAFWNKITDIWTLDIKLKKK
jgi:hypothetical protein